MRGTGASKESLVIGGLQGLKKECSHGGGRGGGGVGETGSNKLLQSTPRQAAERCLEEGGDAWEEGAGCGEPGDAK